MSVHRDSLANFEASCPSTSLGSLDLNNLARQEFDSFDNSAPWARRTPVPPPANFEASTRSACPSLHLNNLAREEFDSFDNSAPWARQMPVHSSANLEARSISTGLSSLDLNTLAREEFDSFDNSAPWARPHSQADFEASISSTGLSSLDLNNLAREEFDSFDNSAPWARMRALSPPAEALLNAPDVSRDRDSSSSGCGSHFTSAESTSSSSMSSSFSALSSSLSGMPSALQQSPAYPSSLAHRDSDPDFVTAGSWLISMFGTPLRLILVTLSLPTPPSAATSAPTTAPASLNAISLLWDLVSYNSRSYICSLVCSVSLVWDLVSCVFHLSLYLITLALDLLLWLFLWLL
ncbi:hypothetical protein K474DRAFT_1673725 [Panus rudis PR-1116 ss-1]|nr:hypothetical protein K474DRAFT_1673725 [Panus rudis PR-1116 ss-1]